MTSFTASKSSSLKGEITVPGDKSISHRSLIIASQAIGTSKVTGLLEGEDVLCTAQALREMGVQIEKQGSTWVIKGVGVGGLAEPKNVLEMGNSGTSTRLLMGLIAPYKFNAVMTGDASLRKRPMKRATDPLELIGAKFAATQAGTLPLCVMGTGTPFPIEYKLPVASAQVKSAILLAGLNIKGKTTVIEPKPTRDHSEIMLRGFGAEVISDGDRITIKGFPKLKAQNISVPADPSSAAFLVVAALITEDSELLIKNVGMNPLRTGLFETLVEMGAHIEPRNQREECGEKVADLFVKYSKLKGIEVPPERAPSMIDEYPVLAVAASFAEGKTYMRGLEELRVKESDRLQTVYDALTANGVKAQISGNDLIVDGAETVRGGAMVSTHLDHRIAMAFLVMGLASENDVKIDDGAAINTSFPGFVNLMRQIGANVKSDQKRALVVTIDGPAASGKGTLSRRVADLLNVSFLDTGSIYRAVALKMLNKGLKVEDEQGAIAAASEMKLEDLSNPQIRQEEVGKAASIISAYPSVREVLLQFQRGFAQREGGAVLDGRDAGTVVYPEADVKFFVTASLDARARRRYTELMGQGVEVNYNSVLDSLKERDERDEKREVAPLKAAKDAVVIDTTDLTAEQVFAQVKDIIAKKSAD